MYPLDSDILNKILIRLMRIDRLNRNTDRIRYILKQALKNRMKL